MPVPPPVTTASFPANCPSRDPPSSRSAVSPTGTCTGKRGRRPTVAVRARRRGRPGGRRARRRGGVASGGRGAGVRRAVGGPGLRHGRRRRRPGAGRTWEDFRSRLVTAIDEDPQRPYYESWVVALERLVLDTAAVTTADLDRARGRAASYRYDEAGARRRRGVPDRAGEDTLRALLAAGLPGPVVGTDPLRAADPGRRLRAAAAPAGRPVDARRVPHDRRRRRAPPPVHRRRTPDSARTPCSPELARRRRCRHAELYRTWLERRADVVGVPHVQRRRPPAAQRAAAEPVPRRRRPPAAVARLVPPGVLGRAAPPLPRPSTPIRPTASARRSATPDGRLVADATDVRTYTVSTPDHRVARDEARPARPRSAPPCRPAAAGARGSGRPRWSPTRGSRRRRRARTRTRRSTARGSATARAR